MRRVGTGLARQATIVAACVLAVASPATAGAGGGTDDGRTERVSVSSGGHHGNGISGRFSAPDLSGDGRVAAFDSEARNLTPDDATGHVDVFAHDRTTGVTELLSVSTAGEQGDDFSAAPSVDAAGTLVAFHSAADNLVPADANSSLDVFLRDRLNGTTEMVSVTPGGRPGNSGSHSPELSPTGRWVGFVSEASNLVRSDRNRTTDVFVRDRLEGRTELVSVNDEGVQGRSSSTSVAVSESGRYVAFGSFASNLVRDDDNGAFDVFLRDRAAGRTFLVSRSTTGERGDGPSSGPAISADGRYVAYYSDATNLVPDDTNQLRDVFVTDMATGTTERVNVSSAGAEADSQTGFSVRGGPTKPDISADGRYVTFDSSASNLVADDTNGEPDVFRRDRLQGTTTRMSIGDDEQQADGDSSDTAVDASGLVVAFVSLATNLVPNDTNTCVAFPAPGTCPDVFVRDERR